MLSPHDVFYFQTIARLKSLRAAASELHVTQPGLSHALKRLETAMGVSLFERTPKGLKTTAEGRRLLEMATPVLEQWRQLDAESTETDTRRRLRFGMHASVAAYFAPGLLDTLTKRDLTSGFEFVHGLSRDLVRLVLEGELEIALAMNPTPHPSLLIRELLTDSVQVFAAPALKRAGSRSEHLIYDPALSQSQWLIKAHAKQGQTFSTHSHSSNLEVIRELAEAAIGAAILPSRVAALSRKPLIPLWPAGKETPQFRDRLCMVCRPQLARTSFGKALLQTIKETGLELQSVR
jgi:DNA-binding transcriptional LysR family regulator